MTAKFTRQDLEKLDALLIKKTIPAYNATHTDTPLSREKLVAHTRGCIMDNSEAFFRKIKQEERLQAEAVDQCREEYIPSYATIYKTLLSSSKQCLEKIGVKDQAILGGVTAALTLEAINMYEPMPS